MVFVLRGGGRFMADIVLCCCGGYEASEPNGFCEYCVSLCISRILKGFGCRVLEALYNAERRGGGF